MEGERASASLAQVRQELTQVQRDMEALKQNAVAPKTDDAARAAQV
jgi:hypothetical protein